MRVIIVGAGILGLGHAWAAARQGHQVTVFERTAKAEGASIRNFGMIWPIGQPAGPRLETALRSRQLWQEFIGKSGIYHSSCGSIHLVTREDEMAVLEEFSDRAEGCGYEGKLMTRTEALEACPAARPDAVRGGYWSGTELGIDPPQAMAALAAWLAETHQVQFHWNTPMIEVGTGWARTANGNRHLTDTVIICGGQDLKTLFPEIYVHVGIRRCKLQMISTVPQPNKWSLGPMVAGGLSLRHYEAFAACKSLGPLKARVALETPELDRFGIHVMASQHATGEIILGDSHEYDDAIAPFDSAEIECLMLRELRRFLQFPDWTLSRRWHGIYTRHSAIQFEARPLSGVFIFTAPGGSGMTLGLGMADMFWDSL